MDKIINFFSNLSIKDEARAIKVGIATLIAVYISDKVSIIDATTTCVSIYLIYAMFFTVSGSRSYAKRRIFSNVYGLIISVIIGFIFKWNMYALSLVFFINILVYYKLNLEGKINIMSSGIGAMTFYVGVGNGMMIVHRFISMMTGFAIAILTNELILPINHGLIVENSIRKLSKTIFKIEVSIIEKEEMEEVNCKNILTQVNTLEANVNLLEKETKSDTIRNHLEEYKTKIELFRLVTDIFKKAYLMIKYIDESRESFNNLNKEEKMNVIYIISNLYNNHRILMEQVITDEFDRKNRIEIVKYHDLNLDSKFNVVLISKFSEYKDSILKLNNYLGKDNKK